MKASALMFELRGIINKHGDLPIVGGHLSDGKSLKKVLLVDEYGCGVFSEKDRPYGIYLTQ